jgi:DNA-directed RNA polymerase specialized sigma24 family protein
MKKIINLNEIILPVHYFNKMLKNISINEKKKRKYNSKHETLIGFEESDMLIVGVSTRDYVDFGDWRNLIKDECLFNGLLSLTQKELILLKMWAVDGYSQKDLAVLTGSTEDAIRKRIKRIKNKVSKNYK